MAKVTMLKGLPGSGKSTYAKARESGTTIRVNKDDIRNQMGLKFSRDRMQEYSVIDRRDDIICRALEAGHDVIVDDTNFGKKHEPRLRELARRYGAEFEVDDSFLAVPVETCIERDGLRTGKAKVGPDVIWGMAETHMGIKKPKPSYVDDPNLPSAIICDLDGTLALFEGLRGPFEHEKCAEDRINLPIQAILNAFSWQPDPAYTFIYLSGREEKFRVPTEFFLAKHTCPPGPLYMRATGDNRPDPIVKRELFDAKIGGKYRIEFVLDDRDRVVKMWRDMGLTCLQVNFGDF